MRDRRELLKLMGGAAALGATLTVGGAIAAAPELRRSVTVGGKRVRTVDVHCHCVVDLSDVTRGTPLERLGRTDALPGLVEAKRIEAMNRQRIDVQVISINPWWYAADQTLAARLIEQQNLRLLEAVKPYPGRFEVMATVALQHPELAAEQLRDAVRRGMKGCGIGCSVNGQELADRRFDPFWKTAEALGTPVFIHPQNSAVATGVNARVQGSGDLTNVIGNPLETTIALAHLIFEGTLDRFPNLKLAAAHGGGYAGSYVDRFDHGCDQPEDPCKAGPVLKKKPSEYMRRIYVDTLVFTPEAVRHLAAVCGPGHMMIGTDYPFPWVNDPIAPILATPGLSDADKIAMLGGTACKLFGIPA